MIVFLDGRDKFVVMLGTSSFLYITVLELFIEVKT